ncbi:hypothetical protein [Streptomyces violascens]|uniref:hypothetical protein n=1 Tax=Streptomyces violascens TaxID=67381 RepID=UPI0016749F05|nr:hypothetical protein [Streptomyces violascens]
MNGNRPEPGEGFPAALDGWTAADWQAYRARVAAGEGSAAVVDSISTRRRAASRAKPGPQAAS